MKNLYDLDFYLWTEETVQQIKQHKFDSVDWENLIEEIEGLGRSEKRAIRSHLTILLIHLLKWQYQPEYRCGSWEGSILNARYKLINLLDENPSLKGDFLIESVPKAYEEARKKASHETTVFLENFPKECPYSLNKMLDEDWLPGVNS